MCVSLSFAMSIGNRGENSKPKVLMIGEFLLGSKT